LKNVLFIYFLVFDGGNLFSSPVVCLINIFIYFQPENMPVLPNLLVKSFLNIGGILKNRVHHVAPIEFMAHFGLNEHFKVCD